MNKYKKEIIFVPNAFLFFFFIFGVEILYNYQIPYFTQKLFPGIEI